MKLVNNTAELYIPNNKNKEEALSQTTHMSIAAHHDDIEIMAYHGIEQCFQSKTNHFTGVVVTNGSGSARDNLYKDYSDEEMILVRKQEQKKAAHLGEFSALFLLDYQSKEIKSKTNKDVVKELAILLDQTRPKILYTHNLADKHDTHVGVAVKTINAIRTLPLDVRPNKVYGCEVWRALDWINDNEKELLDVSNHPNLAASLVEIFDSQIIGGKRYDSATIGRRLANATFSSSHEIDASNAVTYAMDLTPLIEDDNLDILEYVVSYIERFKNDVQCKIQNVL